MVRLMQIEYSFNLYKVFLKNFIFHMELKYLLSTIVNHYLEPLFSTHIYHLRNFFDLNFPLFIEIQIFWHLLEFWRNNIRNKHLHKFLSFEHDVVLCGQRWPNRWVRCLMLRLSHLPRDIEPCRVQDPDERCAKSW